MRDPLASIEADFEALALHLSALIDLHVEDRSLADLDRLRAARDRAVRAIELIRQSRGSFA
jgi:hypothetical protein